MYGRAVTKRLRQVPPTVTTLTKALAQHRGAAPGVKALQWGMPATPRMMPNDCQRQSSVAQMQSTMQPLGQHHDLHETAGCSGSVPRPMSAIDSTHETDRSEEVLIRSQHWSKAMVSWHVRLQASISGIQSRNSLRLQLSLRAHNFGPQGTGYLTQ